MASPIRELNECYIILNASLVVNSPTDNNVSLIALVSHQLPSFIPEVVYVAQKKERKKEILNGIFNIIDFFF